MGNYYLTEEYGAVQATQLSAHFYCIIIEIYSRWAFSYEGAATSGQTRDYIRICMDEPLDCSVLVYTDFTEFSDRCPRFGH